MNSLRLRIFAFLSSSIALLSACTGSDDPSSTLDTYNQRCADNLNIEGFQADFGGYKEGKSIPFKHSDGYLFSLTVTSKDQYFDDFCAQRQSVVLESLYPIYYITVSAGSLSYFNSDADKMNLDTISVHIGQYLFTLRNPEGLKKSLVKAKDEDEDSSRYVQDTAYVDTMEINGVTYTEVAVSQGRKQVNENKTAKSDARLYYQAKKGILKIELEDGSYIAINEKEKK